MNILCIDPGTTESGVVAIADGGQVLVTEPVQSNEIILHQMCNNWVPEFDLLLIEMIASYGMPVGRETFETCVWIGRFVEAFQGKAEYVYRRDVKLTLCNSMRAKDANVRQAILDRFPPTGGGKTPQVGTKAKPGPLFGVKSHGWAALAIGLTWLEKQKATAIVEKRP
jgi:hypothetical protein